MKPKVTRPAWMKTLPKARDLLKNMDQGHCTDHTDKFVKKHLVWVKDDSDGQYWANWVKNTIRPLVCVNLLMGRRTSPSGCDSWICRICRTTKKGAIPSLLLTSL